jgi:hypothetical protein
MPDRAASSSSTKPIKALDASMIFRAFSNAKLRLGKSLTSSSMRADGDTPLSCRALRFVHDCGLGVKNR